MNGETDQTGKDELRSDFSRLKIPRQLEDSESRERWGMPANTGEKAYYLFELNARHRGGVSGSASQFEEVFTSAIERNPQPEKFVKIAESYYRCKLTMAEVRTVLDEDRNFARNDDKEARVDDWKTDGTNPEESIYRVWPDFKVQPHTDHSMRTVKSDAAVQSFGASGEGITWAVIDSGVDAGHPHFSVVGAHALNDPAVSDLHRCFVCIPLAAAPLASPDDPGLSTQQRNNLIALHRQAALKDDYGHGTHVAGIIAGESPQPMSAVPVYCCEPGGSAGVGAGGGYTIHLQTTGKSGFRGAAPHCKLVSLKVLQPNGEGLSSDLIRALAYIRMHVNDNPNLMRIHGVNLSSGYEFDEKMFACGQSPLCAEVNRLVQTGVVVVAAAGNVGYGIVYASDKSARASLANTIRDPGNAESAITVGSTHRDSPHTYGVSYFSSKGPTADGRLKPDLVAPGERIYSCAAGKAMGKAQPPAGSITLSSGMAIYIDDTGTSMAAPHVSGAIAAFLSIRREFIGQPLKVKRIFLETATPLGRECYFEGHGLLDLMRAIQHV